MGFSYSSPGKMPDLSMHAPCHVLKNESEIWNIWLIELRFYVPLNTKQVISEMFFQANLLA